MSVSFSYLNYLEDASPITAITEDASFPVENLIHPFRSKAYRTTSIIDQSVTFDCKYQVRPASFFIINEQRGIQLSEQAIIKLQGTNDANWTTPEADISIDWHESLITKFATTYFGSLRFWRVAVTDPNNIESYIEIGNMFLGETLSLTSSDVKFGWEDNMLDDSEKTESDGNEPWFDVKSQRDRWRFDIEYMNKTDRDNLKQMFKTVGKHKPFYIHLDPETKISDDISELSRYVRLVGIPNIRNIHYDMYNTTIEVEEAK